MKFDDHHKAIFRTLDKENAPFYIEFLDDEIARHVVEMQRAYALIQLWESALSRHQDDIDKAVTLIEKVEKEILNVK